ncbi:hypothetical protein [Novosphingobium terrae]|uniref:hypothetical protein n=1 Tax=Novosphingobium terrae TaxID=2726189 RepID=UPI0019822AEC|nr:hypothetical protein [Novosphingobium terrae]
MIFLLWKAMAERSTMFRTVHRNSRPFHACPPDGIVDIVSHRQRSMRAHSYAHRAATLGIVGDQRTCQDIDWFGEWPPNGRRD